MLEKVKLLAQWLREAQNVVVLTGAGMSTESGVPDFRSKCGWWRGIDPQTVATIDAFQGDYELFHAFYSARIEALQQATPHDGHYVLARLQQQEVIAEIATQNVDGFHQQAGATMVYELHGNIHKIRCESCGKSASESSFLQHESCSCGAKLRPGVVLFGEFLPEAAWQSTLEAMTTADVVIVIGTSLQVAPVNQLPSLTTGKKVYINYDTHFSTAFDLVIEGSAKDTLVTLEQLL